MMDFFTELTREIKGKASTSDDAMLDILTNAMQSCRDEIDEKDAEIARLQRIIDSMMGAIEQIKYENSEYRRTYEEMYEGRLKKLQLTLWKSELRNHAETRDLRAQRDAIPVAAIVRYWRNSNYDARQANANGYTPEMFDDDDALIEEWVNAMENVQHE